VSAIGPPRKPLSSTDDFSAATIASASRSVSGRMRQARSSNTSVRTPLAASMRTGTNGGSCTTPTHPISKRAQHPLDQHGPTGTTIDRGDRDEGVAELRCVGDSGSYCAVLGFVYQLGIRGLQDDRVANRVAACGVGNSRDDLARRERDTGVAEQNLLPSRRPASNRQGAHG